MGRRHHRGKTKVQLTPEEQEAERKLNQAFKLLRQYLDWLKNRRLERELKEKLGIEEKKEPF